MSREEALKTWLPIIKQGVSDMSLCAEALDMAIKALEQESCEDVPDINDGNIYECSCGYGWDQSKVVRHHFCPNCGRAVDNLIKTELNRVKTELEPCEDAVSRQEVIEAIDAKAWEFCDYLIRNGRNDQQIPVSHFADNLRECVGEGLPSVTPQPKVGRWIMSDDGLYRPICNNCGAHPWKGYIPTVEEATEAFKYCPNCGAKMQEVEE